jgi:hypothetical protein
MIEALEHGLFPAIEVTRDAIKSMRSADGEERLRRRLGELGHEERPK